MIPASWHRTVLRVKRLLGRDSDHKLEETRARDWTIGGLTFDTAIHTDVPGLTWREIDVLRGAGVKYLLLQPNASYRGGGIVTRMNEPHAYWWKSPSGERILVWRSHVGYHEVLFFQKGLAGAARDFTARLIDVAADTPFDFFHLTNSGEDGHCDNWPPHPMVMQTAKDWDEKFAWPHIIMSTPRVFFERLEREQGGKLPEMSGDAPDWWAEGVLTAAYETGFSRRMHYLLSDLEFFNALALVRNFDFAYPAADINRTWWANYFFDEHTWGYSNPRAPKHRELFGAKYDLLMKSYGPAQAGVMAAAETLNGGTANDLVLTVFNQHSFRGRIVARTPVRPGDPLSSCAVVLGYERGSGRLASRETRPGQYDPENNEFVFLPDMPLFGIAEIVCKKNSLSTFTSRVTARSSGRLTLENETLRLSFDSAHGGLVSLKLLPSGREVLDSKARYVLGQPIERRRGRGANRGLEFSGVVTGLRVTEGPVFSRVTVSYLQPFRPGERAEVSYTIYRWLPWVDVRCKLTNYHSGPGDSRHLAFPFAAPGKVSVEIPFGEMEPGTELYGYAPFYAVNNWVMVRSPGYTVTWAPLEGQMIEVGAMTKEGNFARPDIRKYAAPAPRPKPYIFSELMNNFQQTNYSITQSGNAEWNYRISFAAPDATVAEAAAPAYLLGRPPIVLPQASTTAPGSLFEISPPSARLVTLKRAEDGDGFIARVVETEGKPVTCRIAFPRRAIASATMTDIVERDSASARVESGAAVFDLPAYSIRNVRLKLAASGGAP